MNVKMANHLKTCGRNFFVSVQYVLLELECMQDLMLKRRHLLMKIGMVRLRSCKDLCFVALEISFKESNIFRHPRRKWLEQVYVHRSYVFGGPLSSQEQDEYHAIDKMANLVNLHRWMGIIEHVKNAFLILFKSKTFFECVDGLPRDTPLS